MKEGRSVKYKRECWLKTLKNPKTITLRSHFLMPSQQLPSRFIPAILKNTWLIAVKTLLTVKQRI